MSPEICLSEKHCTPCQGGVSPLSKQIRDELLLKLGNDWAINDVGHLHKVYLFNDFVGAMSFANAISVIEGGRPNCKIYPSSMSV